MGEGTEAGRAPTTMVIGRQLAMKSQNTPVEFFPARRVYSTVTFCDAKWTNSPSDEVMLRLEQRDPWVPLAHVGGQPQAQKPEEVQGP